MICANGQVLAQAPQFDVRDVVVISATIDVDDVRSYHAPPTAELRPMTNNDNDKVGDKDEHTQLDEEEMGMTYEELGWFGKLRKIGRCGPVSM